MKRPMRVAVTGAAGQIGYSLLFRIASGEMLGKDQPVILQLLEIPDEKAQKALKGVIMELDDCAFPLLESVIPTADPKVAFKDADVALLVGARPRGPGMERKDLLEANGNIFAPQGKALSEVASRDVKVLVVGNPANTNCLIAMKNAPKLKPTNFTAMMRLDHNRALTQVAQKVGRPVSSIRKMGVWGNHSATQYPDVFNAEVDGKPAWPLINDQKWLEDEFIPTIQKRGAAIIDARGLSSAASAANAAIDHVRSWVYGAGQRLGEHGHSRRWQLWHRRRRDLRLSRDVPGRTLSDRARPPGQRLQQVTHAGDAEGSCRRNAIRLKRCSGNTGIRRKAQEAAVQRTPASFFFSEGVPAVSNTRPIRTKSWSTSGLLHEGRHGHTESRRRVSDRPSPPAQGRHTAARSEVPTPISHGVLR